MERFLAQARDDYSEFNYPRRWIPAAAVALILFFGNVPTMLVPILAGFSTVLGAVGALFGRALSSLQAEAAHN